MNLLYLVWPHKRMGVRPLSTESVPAAALASWHNLKPDTCWFPTLHCHTLGLGLSLDRYRIERLLSPDTGGQEREPEKLADTQQAHETELSGQT